MTDNEIIEALECCTDGECENCPMNNMADCAKSELEKEVLALINRQKAEIDGLQLKIKSYNSEIAELKAEVERLRNTVKTDFLTVREKLKISQSDIVEIRTEAIKEFAEMLKNNTTPITLGGKYKAEISYDVVSKEGIDNLVKEMTEGEQGQK